MFHMELSSLIRLELERSSWKTVQALARATRDREVHTYAKERIKELGRQMLEVAKDEIEIASASSDSDSGDSTAEDKEPVVTESVGISGPGGFI